MEQQRQIAILGSTGSIGRQALDIIGCHPDMFGVSVLTAGRQVDSLISQALHFHPRLAVIADESKFHQLRDGLRDTGIECAAGEQALVDAMTLSETDMVLTSTVGYSGLEPTLKAIENHKDIALANKETLVVAGDLVTRRAQQQGVNIYPVDSEHSAIYQCLMGEEPDSVSRLIITASGGPFRTWSLDELRKASVKDALNHPNWHMGNKITIDSATMMNKAFEMIEARWLFGLPIDKIKAVVHPQSVIHSMVEMVDGSVKAQLGVPDMRLPIKFALTRCQRLPVEDTHEFLTLERMANLTFEEPDTTKFPCLLFAYLASERGGNTACVINAANEIAVAAFLNERLKFTQIPQVIEKTLDRVAHIGNPTLEQYVLTNDEARRVASEIIG